MVKRKKIKKVASLAIKSSLGWLLNCPVAKSDDIAESNVNLIQSSHVLKVSCKVKNEALLTQTLQRFWNLDWTGIKEN